MRKTDEVKKDIIEEASGEVKLTHELLLDIRNTLVQIHMALNKSK